ncbi:hypothetical protein [Marinobacterium aestuariivivens]|uniref:YhdP central domain-containing protein n=1 Tax=Marinobacterium aestuariivivens TaxID=1698799 RepID=A0ABW1ZWD7_9GAMM
MKGGLRRILGWLGWACAGLLLLLALVVTLARQFLPAVAEYREPLAGLLSDQLGVPVDIGTLEADWSGRWPRLRLTDLRTFADTEAGPEVRTRIGRLEFELDLLQSLLNRFPIVDQARMDGLEVVWRQHDGRWLHRPGEGEGAAVSGPRPGTAFSG